LPFPNFNEIRCNAIGQFRPFLATQSSPESPQIIALHLARAGWRVSIEREACFAPARTKRATNIFLAGGTCEWQKDSAAEQHPIRFDRTSSWVID
jgi:hypothetical protein